MAGWRSRLRFPIGPSSGLGLILWVAALVLGSSRDFGAFLLSIVVLPGLSLATVVFAILDLRFHRPKAASAGLTLLALSPVPYFAAELLHDRVSFAAWALTHPSVIAHPGSTRVVETWDGYGMAGMKWDSYLVVDARRELGTTVGNQRWLRAVGQTCELVEVHREWASLYLVTTYECPFDGFPS